MTKKRKILVTSALPYSNGPIHIGHIAGAYLPADIFVRYHRLKGDDVVFICGADEHGVPITIAARKRGITQHYPYLCYPIRNEVTKKRCISAENLRRLYNAELPDWQRKYVDFFFASFFLIGMNTEDLLHATDIVDGRLEFWRAKTHKPYTIKIEPECQAIFERMAGKRYLLNPLDTYAKTCHWTSRVDNVLKDIAAKVGLPRISMYWTRHSWMTIATELEIPKETIIAAAGHGGGKTVTDIYIDFDISRIDRANRQVIDYVLYGKRKQTVEDMFARSFDELKKQLSGNAG